MKRKKKGGGEGPGSFLAKLFKKKGPQIQFLLKQTKALPSGKINL